MKSVVASNIPDITFDELLNADVRDLPLKTRIDAFFSGTEAFASFIEQVMTPLLHGLLQPDDKEIAVIGTYYRICLQVRSLKALNNAQHFQAVAAIVRSIFELRLDLKLLAVDSTGDAVRKYHAFPEVERFRVATQLVEFDAKAPGLIKSNLGPHRAFIQDSARIARVESAKIQPSGGNRKARYPTHWSGGNLRDRAKRVGLESEYLEMYPLLSWYVHSGSTGVAGLSPDALESCFGLCHASVQRMLLDATIVCAAITKISDATADSFKEWMEQLRLTPGIVITEEQVKQLKRERV